MRITTKISWNMISGVVYELETFEYSGPLDLACGASNEQTQIFKGQQSLMKQLVSQAQSIFGSVSGGFNDIMKAFSPILAAGPNQKGYSAPLEAALKSEAITDTGQAYKNAKEAVGENFAAQGGGNVALPGGTQAAEDANLAGQGAEQTASALTKINESNYDVGRQNFDTAAKAIESAPSMFSPATSAGDAATSAGSAAAKTADDISQSNNQWVSAVTGALGGIAGNLIKPGGWLGKTASSSSE